MKRHGITINAGNSTTVLASGLVQSGIMGDAAGKCYCHITDIFCPNNTIISTDDGSGAVALVELAAGSHSFDPPLICPSGAGVYSNAYDVSIRYYLKDGFPRKGAYS
tara:strand:- start:541 stop:861 length:321 start_codon:yes stop_codon:yes gene_type:complete